jgi:hypothetical protein
LSDIWGILDETVALELDIAAHRFIELTEPSQIEKVASAIFGKSEE